LAGRLRARRPDFAFNIVVQILILELGFIEHLLGFPFIADLCAGRARVRWPVFPPKSSIWNFCAQSSGFHMAPYSPKNEAHIGTFSNHLALAGLVQK
jgi:hypothetical protein